MVDRIINGVEIGHAAELCGVPASVIGREIEEVRLFAMSDRSGKLFISPAAFEELQRMAEARRNTTPVGRGKPILRFQITARGRTPASPAAITMQEGRPSAGGKGSRS